MRNVAEILKALENDLNEQAEALQTGDIQRLSAKVDKAQARIAELHQMLGGSSLPVDLAARAILLAEHARMLQGQIESAMFGLQQKLQQLGEAQRSLKLWAEGQRWPEEGGHLLNVKR